MHTCMYTYMFVYMHACLNVSLHVRMRMCVSMSIWASVRLSVCDMYVRNHHPLHKPFPPTLSKFRENLECKVVRV